MSQNIEWYYLGDLVVFVAAGSDDCGKSATIKDETLVEALYNMRSNKEVLRYIMEGGKLVDEPIIFNMMRDLTSEAKFPLPKKLKMDLMICTMPPPHKEEVLVGSDKIILPWPLPIDVKKYEGKLRDCIDLEPKDLPKEDLLQIDPWMQTVEELIYDPGGRDYLDKFIKSKDHREIIKYAKEVHDRDLIAPSYFAAVPNTKISPIEIFIEQTDKQGKKIINLHVGVKGLKGVAADREDPNALFEKWPCGGL